MSEPFTIAASDPVKRLLGIAKRYLRYIEKSRSKGLTLWAGAPPPPKLDHAIVASIFSAAAIKHKCFYDLNRNASHFAKSRNAIIPGLPKSETIQ